MIYIDEEQQEYEMMYHYVMRNNKKKLKTKDEVIEYLVTQCYYIDIYNDQLIEIIKKIKTTIGINKITKTDLPF
jgi:non-homologous end joining protein Ku